MNIKKYKNSMLACTFICTLVGGSNTIVAAQKTTKKNNTATAQKPTKHNNTITAQKSAKNNNVVTRQKTTANNNNNNINKSDILTSVKKFYAKPSVKTTLKIVAGIAGLCTCAWVLKYMLSPAQLPAQETPAQDTNEFIINKEPNFFTDKNNNDWALLHLFARNERIDTIKEVLEAHPTVDFNVRTKDGEHIVDCAPENRKQELTNLLKEHLHRLHIANPKEDHLNCLICLETATECAQCNNPTLARMQLTPCCLGVLCQHCFDAWIAQNRAKNPHNQEVPCPHCTAPLK